MSRAVWMFTLVLLAAGCTAAGNPVEQGAKPSGPYDDPKALVQAVERGEAHADAFVEAVQQGPVRFEDVSPGAVANYLEALAWERMLDRIPDGFVDDEVMVLSFDTVFEDPRNVFNNWKAYKAFLKTAYHADVN